MTRDALLAFGFVMPFATQIHVPGLPFTVGEFALLLWIALSVGRSLTGGQLVITPALQKFSLFWFTLAMALCVGMVVGSVTTILYAEDIMHDTMAYILLAMITCLFAAEPDCRHRLQRCERYVVAIANLALAIQVGFAWDLINLPGVTPWYWNRLQGWSENPNQLALYCALFGPIALHLAINTKAIYVRLMGFMGIILSFYVGLLTKSDTYLLAAILGYFIFSMLWLKDWLSSPPSNSGFSRQITSLLLLSSTLFALTFLPFAIKKSENIESFIVGLTRKGERTEESVALRVLVWDQAINKGLRSGSLGLGPGPHLERPSLNGVRAEHVAFEAHNVVLEFYVQGGLLAVMAVCWLVGSAARSTWRTRQHALFSLVALLVLFGLTHVIFRHPLVWFCITLCLMTEVRQGDALPGFPLRQRPRGMKLRGMELQPRQLANTSFRPLAFKH